jgi:hypothetical protein
VLSEESRYVGVPRFIAFKFKGPVEFIHYYHFIVIVS